ncbi:MAG: radical SAM protein [Candidatus Heimdallarchaeota archaeon]
MTVSSEIFDKPDLSWKYFEKQLIAYYPSTSFPSVSLTGTNCAQNCLYCNKHYLKHMHEANTPEKLKTFAYNLAAKGAKGILISGGYNEQATLPLEPFLETIKEIKAKTNLLINLHPGLVSEEEAQTIAKVGVDAISFDLVVDDNVIEQVLRNGFTGKDYLRSYSNLVTAGLRVVPHICLGLLYGKEDGNLAALEAAFNFNPKLIVFLGLIPTKNTPMESAKIIDPEFVARMLLYTRLEQPQIEQSLGCMRVRKIDYEHFALKAGINRIAVPKKRTLDFARKKYDLQIKELNSCCAM